MGVDETFIRNAQSQLDRLSRQLAEVEAEKDSLDEAEYKEMREETVEQLEKLSKTLEKFQDGSMTLLDELTSTKLAIRAAISNAFKTPEVIALFARKEPGLMRERLMMLETTHKSTISKADYLEKKLEMLLALKTMKEELSEDEQKFIDDLMKTPDVELEAASSNRVFQGDI